MAFEYSKRACEWFQFVREFVLRQTQVEAAAKLEMNAKALSRLEKGRHKLTVETFVKLFDYYNDSLAQRGMIKLRLEEVIRTDVRQRFQPGGAELAAEGTDDAGRP